MTDDNMLEEPIPELEQDEKPWYTINDVMIELKAIWLILDRIADALDAREKKQ